MEICVNIFFNSTFSLFSGFQTQQVMTPQIRSHMEYLILNSSYYCAHFVVEIDENSSLNGRFKYDLMMNRNSGLLFGPPCRLQ